MPICIECGFKLANLYTTYSKADDRSLGKGVRLTQCPRCKRFADKYVEHDYVVIFIDLILIKPQVYRHLLFNRLGREDDRFDPSIIRLGILLLLFDVYLTWARIEKAISPLPNSAALASSTTTSSSSSSIGSSTQHVPAAIANSGNAPHHYHHHHPLPGQGTATAPFSAFLSTQPILLQYLFFLSLCFSETAAFHLPIRWVLGLFPPRAAPSSWTAPSPVPPAAAASAASAGDAKHHQQQRQPSPVPPPPPTPPSPLPHATAPPPSSSGGNSGSAIPPDPALTAHRPLVPYYPHPSVVSTALLVSSFTKLFPLLLLIWSYDLPSSASAVSWAVIVNNVAALEILLDCGFPRAVGLAAVGAMCRALVGWGALRAVGVEGGVAAAAVVETGDVVEFGRGVAAWLGVGVG